MTPTRRFVVGAMVAAVVVATACTDDEPDVAPEPTIRVPSDGEPVEVLDVDDGDSFVVRREDGNETGVRLLGVNAPESGECVADESREALTDLLTGADVVLERDISDRDEFGRLLRYVFAGDVFVNQELTTRGLVLAGSYPPDLAHQPELDAAEGLAQADQAGLWNPNACGPADSTDVVIVRTEGDPQGPDNIDLNGEYVVVENTGDTRVDLTGWVLRDSSSQNRFRYPDGFGLAPGAEATVRTGTGPDGDGTLYWGVDHPVWDNSGDTAFLLDSNGNVVSFADLPPSD